MVNALARLDRQEQANHEPRVTVVTEHGPWVETLVRDVAEPVPVPACVSVLDLGENVFAGRRCGFAAALV